MSKIFLNDGTELARLYTDYVLTEKQVKKFMENIKNLSKPINEDMSICIDNLLKKTGVTKLNE